MHIKWPESAGGGRAGAVQCEPSSAAAGPLQMVQGPDGEQVYSTPAAAGPLQMVPGPDGSTEHTLAASRNIPVPRELKMLGDRKGG